MFLEFGLHNPGQKEIQFQFFYVFHSSKRMAVCKKNRYGKTGVGYFIDGMVMEA